MSRNTQAAIAIAAILAGVAVALFAADRPGVALFPATFAFWIALAVLAHLARTMEKRL